MTVIDESLKNLRCSALSIFFEDFCRINYFVHYLFASTLPLIFCIDQRIDLLYFVSTIICLSLASVVHNLLAQLDRISVVIPMFTTRFSTKGDSVQFPRIISFHRIVKKFVPF